MIQRLLFALLISGALVACGGDDDDSSGTGGSAGTSGTAGTSGSAGTGGTAGSAGTGGTAGTGGSAGTGGTSGSAGTAGSSGAGGTAGTAGTAGSAGTGGTAGSSGTAGAGGTAGSAGSGGGEPITEVTVDSATCFTLATATSVSDPACDGDIVFLMGAKVDLQAGNINQGAFCTQTGTFTTLASVPSDYSACTWEMYIEGAFGLANTGYILLDAAGTHHYRMQIVNNDLPTIQFRFDQID